MTAVVTARPRAPAGFFAGEPRLAAAGALIALSLAVTLSAAALDARLFQGDSVWLKPVKFQLSLSLYLLSLAFFARWLPEGLTRRRAWRGYAWVVILAVVAELIWIAGSAAAGVGSHYNVSTPLMARTYQLMGVLAVLLTSASLVWGVAIGLNRSTGLAPALKLAIVLGLVLTFVLTVPIAATLAQGNGHFVGTPATGAALPVLGWSREVGDLRSAHFLATHAMHVLPLIGLALVALLPGRAAVVAVSAASALYVALVLWTFLLGLDGRPLVPLA